MANRRTGEPVSNRGASRSGGGGAGHPLHRLGTAMEFDVARVRWLASLGLIGTLIGVLVRAITHWDAAVFAGAVSGLLFALILSAMQGEEF